MVILWTQLDGVNQDPSERLTNEAQDTATEHKDLGLSAAGPESPFYLDHPRVEGRPPSGRKSSKSSTFSPGTAKVHPAKPTRPNRTKKSPPVKNINSEKCVVSIKEVSFPKAKTPTASPEGEMSFEGDSLNNSLDSSPPNSTGCGTTTKSPRSISLVDSCKVKTITNETPTKVTFRRNGTLKYGTLPESSRKLDFGGKDDDDDQLDALMNNKQKSRKKFYTLPRNWKAADLFRINKGEYLNKRFSEYF